MTERDNRLRRHSCERCARPVRLCYCHLLHPPLENRWPVHLLQHKKETTHPLNTGRIAHLGLLHSHLDISGDVVASSAIPAASPVLIYPGPESRPLEELSDQAPRPLVFIDASWKKSRRMLLGSQSLCALPRYHFIPVEPSRYRLRKAPSPAYYSTLEAIVTTLGVLEQDNERYQSLYRAMDWLIERQIDHIDEATLRSNYPHLSG